MAWRQRLDQNATVRDAQYGYDGVIAQDMDPTKCDSFNRLYDDNAWLIGGEGLFFVFIRLPSRGTRSRNENKCKLSSLNYLFCLR